MSSKKVSLAITPERDAAFQAIWGKLPHLTGSISATIDYLLTFYLDPRGLQTIAPEVKASITNNDELTTGVNPLATEDDDFDHDEGL